MRPAGLAAGFVICLLLAGTLPAAAAPAPGAAYLFPGFGARQVGLGFTGVTALSSLDALWYNPAVAGDFRRLANGLTVGGLGGDSLLVSPAFAWPTDYGVLTVDATWQSVDTASGYDSLLGLGIGIAKPITPNLFWGFALRGARAGAAAGTSPAADWQLGFDMGVLYADREPARGFGFLNPAWGVVLRNVGKTMQFGTYDRMPGLGLGAGFSFSPVVLKGYRARVSIDASLAVVPLQPGFGLGLEQTFFEAFHLRVGYLPKSGVLGWPDIGPVTFGLGFTGRLGLTDVHLDYALAGESWSGRTGTAHHVSASIAWGWYDDVKPKAAVTPRHVAFSPNVDGSQDSVPLAFALSDNVLVDAWTLEIRDGAGKVVRAWRSVPKLELRTLDFSKFVSQVFSKKRQVEIPAEIVWNGHDEAGRLVPDGTYRAVLSGWDENKNVASSTVEVTVDTVVPTVDCRASFAVFSPNGDGRKDTQTISLAPTNLQPGDRVSAAVRDAQGQAVRTWGFTNTVPAGLAWDGKDDAGRDAPEGDYRVVVNAADAAGNNSARAVDALRLVRRIETPTAEGDAAIFAPGDRDLKDALVVRCATSSPRGLESWKLTVADAAGKPVRVLSGGKTLPQELAWDGRDDGGKLVPDGFYGYELALAYDSGNAPVSQRRFVETDTSRPALTVRPQYLAFSPNGDGNQDTIAFDHTCDAEESDVISLRILDETGAAVREETWKKANFPVRYTWDGKDRDGKVLPEGRYAYRLSIADKVGHRAAAAVRDILLKTGTEKVAVTVDNTVFSPGNERALPRTAFKPVVTATNGIIDYRLEIRDAGGKTVRLFRAERYLPELAWDGKDDGGRKLPDGTYTYKLTVKYSYGDQPVSAEKRVRIDTRAPELDVAARDRFFSPNGDGRKEQLRLAVKAVGEPGDAYEGEFTDAAGKPVRTYRWRGTVPAELVWDGKDNAGKEAPEGLYSFTISGIDTAKNEARAATRRLVLVRALDKATLGAAPMAFSPALGGKLAVAKLAVGLVSTNWLEKGVLVVYDQARRPIRTFTFAGQLPAALSWDGKDERGRPAPDGRYDLELEVDYWSGNRAVASLAGLALDAEPPQARLVTEPEVFTPDGDGENDLMQLNLDVADSPSGVAEWALRVFKRTEKGRADKPFRAWSGKGPVRELYQWDGTGDDKEDIVEAVQDYELELTAVDRIGNRLAPVVRPFTTGVLVEKTPDGLRIRVSSVRFAFDSTDMLGNTRPTLDKVFMILRKILAEPAKYGLPANCKIEISGHTDDIGTPDYNKALSERRAKAVLDYYLKKDIDPRVLTFVGHGMSRPVKEIKPGMDWRKIVDYRDRNRRVEFFIRK